MPEMKIHGVSGGYFVKAPRQACVGFVQSGGKKVTRSFSTAAKGKGTCGNNQTQVPR
jgi:hypothetical protein